MSTTTQQKGAASSTPSALFRWLSSKVASKLIDASGIARKRAKAESLRVKQGRHHVVDYFHQVDDPYSHLALQVLPKLVQRYGIDLNVHLVSSIDDDNNPEPKLLAQLARRDTAMVADGYQLSFKSTDEHLEDDTELRSIATQALAKLSVEQWLDGTALKVSELFWANDQTRLTNLAKRVGSVSASDATKHVKAGNRLRAKRKHYLGAMFFYEGEWYWGVDRLYHLERRFKDLGLGGIQARFTPTIARPQPTIKEGELADSGLTLEFYVSLRSPYTAVIYQAVLDFAKRSGLQLAVKPVLPMVMRGVTATREKGFYIFSDAAREAREQGVPFKAMYDPIGEPVLRCYALYPWAVSQGKGEQLLGSFLNAAFNLAINTNNDKGLRWVVEDAGLSWAEAKQHLADTSMTNILEENRQTMLGFGSWGVPSFNLLDKHGKVVINCWGQDRLWLIQQAASQFLKAKAQYDEYH